MIGQVGRGQVDRTHSEVVERQNQPLGILGIDEHPHIEVLGGSRVSVCSDRVAADDQVVDLTPVAALDELDEVRTEELHPRTPD
jgi:hypothetical protein